MKKSLILLTLALTACSQQWNDLVHREVVAEILEFEIEGQLESSILGSYRTVDVLMPPDTDPSALRISVFKVTDGARLNPEMGVGTVLDLSQPQEVMLTTYDPYKWTISAKIKERKRRPDEVSDTVEPGPLEGLTNHGPQIYNLNLDSWCKLRDSDGNIFELVDYPYAEDASEEEKAVWSTNDEYIGLLLGTSIVSAEHTFLAVSGEGKAAAKLETKAIESMDGQLANGCLFTGKALVDFLHVLPPIQAEWGTPFTGLPAALEGYACYQPETIKGAQEPFEAEEGKTDKGSLLLLLTAWNAPLAVIPPETQVDFERDVIGYGKITFTEANSGYVKFQVPIKYLKEGITPTYITIIATSSAYGDYHTGGHGSTLYLDELELKYK